MSTILSNGSLSLQDFICFILKCFITSIISLESGYGTNALARNNNNFGGVTGSGDAGYTVATVTSSLNIQALKQVLMQWLRTSQVIPTDLAM